MKTNEAHSCGHGSSTAIHTTRLCSSSHACTAGGHRRAPRGDISARWCFASGLGAGRRRASCEVGDAPTGYSEWRGLWKEAGFETHADALWGAGLLQQQGSL